MATLACRSRRWGPAGKLLFVRSVVSFASLNLVRPPDKEITNDLAHRGTLAEAILNR